MDKNNKNKISLFEAIRQQKKDMYRSLWRIEINFNITNHIDLKAYCDKEGLIQIETKDIWQQMDFKIDKKKFFEKVKNDSFYETGILEKERFKSFGIFEKTANIFGHNIDEILMLKLTFHEDQTIDNDKEEYWGFFDYRDNKLNNINNRYGLMSICCASGAKISEEKGNGFAVKLNIEIVEDKFITNWWNNLTDLKRIDYIKEVMELEADGQEIRKNISSNEIKRIFNYYYLMN